MRDKRRHNVRGMSYYHTVRRPVHNTECSGVPDRKLECLSKLRKIENYKSCAFSALFFAPCSVPQYCGLLHSAASALRKLCLLTLPELLSVEAHSSFIRPITSTYNMQYARIQRCIVFCVKHNYHGAVIICHILIGFKVNRPRWRWDDGFSGHEVSFDEFSQDGKQSIENPYNEEMKLRNGK